MPKVELMGEVLPNSEFLLVNNVDPKKIVVLLFCEKNLVRKGILQTRTYVKEKSYCLEIRMSQSAHTKTYMWALMG